MRKAFVSCLVLLLVGVVGTPVFAAERAFSAPTQGHQRAFSAPRQVVKPGSDFSDAFISIMAFLGGFGQALVSPNPATIGGAAAAFAYVAKVNPQKPTYADSNYTTPIRCFSAPCASGD